LGTILAQSVQQRTPILRPFVLRGNPSGEIAGVAVKWTQSIMCDDRLRPDAITGFLGGAMDLAMAMSVALFGMFTGSTIYFFYKFAR
jgi:hypothetical protein